VRPSLAVEFFVDHFTVFHVGSPEEKNEVTYNHGRHDDELQPVDGIVEIILDNVMGRSRIGV
jgi:hypothetical protein